MKAEMTAAGTLVLTPETGMEAFAMMRWAERAIVEQPDEKRAETFHWRDSAITVDLSHFPETLRVEVDPVKWAREWNAAAAGEAQAPQEG